MREGDPKDPSGHARRALEEAKQRRADQTKRDSPESKPPAEHGGPGPNVPEPTRYGDWEYKGITRDF